jgi:hypothetical protein
MRKPKHKTSGTRTATATRRDFLKGAAVAAAAAVSATPANSAAEAALLPAVALGPNKVTRLIVGGNPIYGYSHFNRQYDQHMLEYFTTERTVELLLNCERAGINTWQTSYNSRFPGHHEAMRAAGCKIQWICLAAAWDIDRSLPRTPEAILSGTIRCAEVVAKFKPVGIAFHGWATDLLWREGKVDTLRSFVDRVHDLGIPAGLSTHNPVILEALAEKNWPNDFFMASFHYLSRRPEEFQKELGVVPVGETYLSTDPEKMCNVVRKVEKPCLVYKVFAAGRLSNSPQQVRQALEFCYRNIKPSDAAILGLYPRYSDQIGEDTRIVRELVA